MEYRLGIRCRSFGLRARELDHVAPLNGLVGDELPKVAGEPASTVPPRSARRAFILGSDEGGVDLLVQTCR